ncbi:hypothetical protein ACXNSR_20725 [Streptomyces sp. NC-S4]
MQKLCIRCEGTPLAPSVRADSRVIEFIARSSSSDHICGITAEAYDYWIVSLTL